MGKIYHWDWLFRNVVRKKVFKSFDLGPQCSPIELHGSQRISILDIAICQLVLVLIKWDF